MQVMLARLRQWARALKAQVVLLWLAARDPRVPLAAKLLAGLFAAYALSPIDLIPDFIPVLGLLDDLVILPLGLWLALRLIPDAVAQDLRARAVDRAALPKSWTAALAIAAIWVAAAGLAWRALSPSS
jgi:uncharacterized membrane protein YkvA (DUF1232 family)